MGRRKTRPLMKLILMLLRNLFILNPYRTPIFYHHRIVGALMPGLFVGRIIVEKATPIISLILFRGSMAPPDTAYSPTQDKADDENDQKHQRAGHGDGPGKKIYIYRLDVLKDENERENTENDP